MDNINEKESLKYQYAFIDKIIKQVGPRLPGSSEEEKAAKIIAEDFTKLTDVKSIIEPFSHAPLSSIGFIPVLGYLLIFVLIPLYYFSPLITIIFGLFFYFFAICQIFRYTGWFDFLFPKSISHNVYSILEPPSGQINYTLVLSGHIDTSWHSPLFEKNPKMSTFKIIYGVLGGLILILFSIIRVLVNYDVINWNTRWMLFLPVFLLPGFIFIARYIVYSKEKASPGAMDDLSGIAMSMWLVKYWLKNPNKRPKNCRIVLLAIGAEEAGLKGSFAFIKKHQNNLLSPENNPYILVLDGIGDKDFVHVISGDDWLGTKYDPKLIRLADEAMNELGIKHDIMNNPAGGTDAGAYARNNIKAVCLAAQDPGPGDNYHTNKDTLERIEKEATIAITKSSLLLISKLDDFINQE